MTDTVRDVSSPRLSSPKLFMKGSTTSNMHMADLDSAIAHKCKENKENINFPGRSGLLVSSLVGVFILKVWSYLCWKPVIPVKRLKHSGILNLDAPSQTTPIPLCHLSELLGTSGDHRPLMPPEFLREGCKAKTSNLFWHNTPGFSLPVKEIYAGL